jgi:hypothetical protein
MRHACRVLLVLVLTTGASPPRGLPVPPIPPADPQTAQRAPVPDRDAQGPAAIVPEGPHVRVQDFRADRFNNQGLGYTPGSHYSTSEDRRPIQTPGLAVQLPLR